MKQRIRVVGIVQNGRELLIAKRSIGRLDGPAIWEVPTGKIRFGEQPEEALARALEENLGIETSENMELIDVITFVAPQGSSQLNNLYIVFRVSLTKDAKITARERYSAYKYVKPEELSEYRLDEASLTTLEIESRGDEQLAMRELAHGATVYVDGCSRGNPGPAGIGYVVVGEDGAVLTAGGEFIGFATSRVAEYYALKEGCERAIMLGLKRVRFVGDNLMMINQMRGTYKVKNQDILPIYDDIQEMLKKFEAYAFRHIKREQNQQADQLANEAVDKHFGINEK